MYNIPQHTHFYRQSCRYYSISLSSTPFLISFPHVREGSGEETDPCAQSSYIKHLSVRGKGSCEPLLSLPQRQISQYLIVSGGMREQ